MLKTLSEHARLQQIRIAAERRDASACAAGWRRFTRGVTPKDRDRLRLLVLDKGPFTVDLKAAFGESENVELVLLRRGAVKSVASAFLPPEIDDNFYINAGAFALRRMLGYREFLAAVWKKFAADTRVDAVLSGNFGYYAERELAAAVSECGTPFIVVHKENLKTPGLVEFWRVVYKHRRGPFHGTQILTYNGIERQLQLDAGVADPERIRVVGMPRLDRAFQLTKVRTERPSILAFSFDATVGLPLLVRKRRGRWREKPYVEPLGDSRDALRWTRLHAGFHETLVELAREHPGIDVVVKAKGAQLAAGGVRFLSASGKLPPNLHIKVGGDPFDLIARSSVVTGFNSTALLEAIAAGRPVVSPGFEEASEEAYRPYVVNLAPVAQTADSPRGLRERLAALAQWSPAAPDSAERARLLEKWVGNPDGKSCERMRTAIYECVSSTQNHTGKAP